jgi:hypothetical protein
MLEYAFGSAHDQWECMNLIRVRFDLARLFGEWVHQDCLVWLGRMSQFPCDIFMHPRGFHWPYENIGGNYATAVEFEREGLARLIQHCEVEHELLGRLRMNMCFQGLMVGGISVV